MNSPISVSNIDSFLLFADYHYTGTPKGNHSLAYDVFLREPGTQLRKAEIMVVLDRTQYQNHATFKGTCFDGINNYRIYEWTSNGMISRSFRLQLPAAGIPHEINLKSLIRPGESRSELVDLRDQIRHESLGRYRLYRVNHALFRAKRRQVLSSQCFPDFTTNI